MLGAGEQQHVTAACAWPGSDSSCSPRDVSVTNVPRDRHMGALTPIPATPSTPVTPALPQLRVLGRICAAPSACALV